MILIITHKQDYTADFVIAKLNELQIAYFRFNCEDLLEYNIAVSYGNAQSIEINGNTNFSSVWYRRTMLPNLSTDNEEEKAYLLNEIDSFLKNLFNIIPAKWLSDPMSMEAAENKLRQLQLAQRIGFKIPNTIITTSHHRLKRFASQHSSIIIKPISRGRINYANGDAKLIFTSAISSEKLECIDDYLMMPSIYQENVPKSYELRVTVVGQDIFAAKVESQNCEATQVDWRRSKLKFSPYFLPDEIATMCLELLRQLNLPFGAFDLIRTPEGNYCFLEVNPNGQWVWIEKDTGLPISNAIINYLK